MTEQEQEVFVHELMVNFFIIALVLICAIALSGCNQQYALVNYSNPTGAVKAAARAQRAQCEDCQNHAAKLENASYKRARAEMEAAHKAEQYRIKHQCDHGEAPAEVVNIVPGPLPSAVDVLPEEGITKSVFAPECKQCKDGKCR